MSIDEQTEDVLLAYELFKSTSRDWAPYATAQYEESNLSKLAEWCRNNLPAGALRERDAFEISFRNTLPALTADPSWKSPEERRAIMTSEYARMTGAQMKVRYENDAEFRRFVD